MMNTPRSWIRLTLIGFTLACGARLSVNSQIPSEISRQHLQTTWTTEEGLPQNTVTAMLQTRDGYLWLGTLGGLVRFDGVKFTTFPASSTEGLKSNRIRALYEDGAGDLWIGAEGGGLTRYRNGAFTNYSLQDGLPGRNAVTSIVPAGADALWVVTNSGLARFQADRLAVYATLGALIHQQVTAVWPRRTVNYSHLPPGAYTFQVIAANGDGRWNREGASLHIVVVPLFWRTWWFYGLVMAGVAGLALLGYQWRIAQLKRRQVEQEAFARRLIDSQEGERKRITAELHDSLSQTLVIIKNRALLSLNQPADQERALEPLEGISGAASQAIDEVKTIAYNLRPYHLDRLGLTQAIKAMLERVSDVYDLEFTTEIAPVDGLFPPEAEISLYRIVQECLSNIVKHAHATAARVSIQRTGQRIGQLDEQRDGDGVEIIISDNGCGLSAASTGGFGLINIAERARMLGGKHTITSAHGQGTTVTVKAPLPKQRKNESKEGQDEE